MAGTLTALAGVHRRLPASAPGSQSTDYDALTGLPGRSAFNRHLDALIGPSTPTQRIGICLVGLDDLVILDEDHGPRAADEALRAVARRLRSFLVIDGYFCARIGYDEFAVLTTGAVGGGISRLLDDLVTIITAPFDVAGHAITIGATVGAAEFPTHGVTAAQLTRAATIARQSAIRGGMRRQVYDSTHDDTNLARHELSAAMPAAILNGEFTPRYQPLIDLADHRLMGFEALARWDHPRYGPLTPDEFIGLAEENGSILALGGEILRQACSDAVELSAGEEGPYMSVNLAPAQICDPHLYQIVLDALATSGLPPHRLQLEVLETEAVYANTTAIDNLTRLTNIGIRVAIDDFGTGYSNLAALASLPFTELKVALPLVQRISENDPDNQTDPLVAFITDLARNLNLTVTAEGIETDFHARRMRKLGCQTGQGWHFGKPERMSTITRQLAA